MRTAPVIKCKNRAMLPFGGTISLRSTRSIRIQQARQERDRGGLRAQPLADRLQLLERVLVAFQARVQARVDVAADHAAAGDQQHAEQRHVAVGRAEAEVGMKQDQDRADHAEDHVEFEPGGNSAHPAQPAKALARRVEQQQQHHRAADDSEPIAEAALRRDVALEVRVHAPHDHARDHDGPDRAANADGAPWRRDARRVQFRGYGVHVMTRSMTILSG